MKEHKFKETTHTAAYNTELIDIMKNIFNEKFDEILNIISKQIKNQFKEEFSLDRKSSEELMEIVLKQKRIVDEQTKHIESLTVRIQTMEELISAFFDEASSSDQKIKMIRYGLKDFSKDIGGF